MRLLPTGGQGCRDALALLGTTLLRVPCHSPLPPYFPHFCSITLLCFAQVFVEYVTNDGYHHGSVDNSLVRSFERLLRKLLGFRHSPAVVLMEFLATDVRMSNIPYYATGAQRHSQSASIHC